MQIVHFRCPHCTAALRIRDEKLVGRPVPCPECGDPILIQRDGADGVAVATAEAAAVDRSSASTRRADRTAGGWKQIVAWTDWNRLSPAVIACIGAMVLVAAGIGFAVLNESPRATRPHREGDVAAATVAKTDLNRDSPPIPQQTIAPEAKPATDVRTPRMPVEAAPAPSPAPSLRSPLVAVRPIVPLSPATPAPATPTAPPRPTIDIQSALDQPILRFEQAKPASLGDLLATIEELVGVPIRAEAAEIAAMSELRQVPIVIDLRDTTVGGILKAVLGKVKLSFEVERDAIRLRKLPSAPLLNGKP